MAVRYDSTSDYLEYASGPTGACTLAGWFQVLSSLKTSTALAIASHAPGANNGNSTIIGVKDATGGVSGYVTGWIDLGFTVSQGDWFFAALTRNGDGGPSTVWKFHASTLVGALVSSADQSNAGWNLTGNRVQVGTSPYASTYNEGLDGTSGPVWVFDSVLTATELDSLRRRIVPLKNPWIWVPGIGMGTGRGNDWSGNGRDFTAGGTLGDVDGPPVSWGSPLWYPQKKDIVIPTLSLPGVQNITANSAVPKVTLTF